MSWATTADPTAFVARSSASVRTAWSASARFWLLLLRLPRPTSRGRAYQPGPQLWRLHGRPSGYRAVWPSPDLFAGLPNGVQSGQGFGDFGGNLDKVKSAQVHAPLRLLMSLQDLALSFLSSAVFWSSKIRAPMSARSCGGHQFTRRPSTTRSYRLIANRPGLLSSRLGLLRFHRPLSSPSFSSHSSLRSSRSSRASKKESLSRSMLSRGTLARSGGPSTIQNTSGRRSIRVDHAIPVLGVHLDSRGPRPAEPLSRHRRK